MVRLPHLSNYTDFAPLEAEEQVDLFYTHRPEEIFGADVIILPGSKNTPLDLAWLKERRLDTCLQKSASQGTWVCGICGGYQMLGETMLTEDGDEIRGLCLLPVRTIFRKDKVTRQVQGSVVASDGLFAGMEGIGITGYEIHMGQTTLAKEASPFARLRMTDAAQPQDLQMEDGCVQGTVFGTYVHGLFDADAFRERFLRSLCREKGIAYEKASHPDLLAYRTAQYDALADAVEQHIDMKKIQEIMGEGI